MDFGLTAQQLLQLDHASPNGFGNFHIWFVRPVLHATICHTDGKSYRAHIYGVTFLDLWNIIFLRSHWC